MSLPDRSQFSAFSSTFLLSPRWYSILDAGPFFPFYSIQSLSSFPFIPLSPLPSLSTMGGINITRSRNGPSVLQNYKNSVIQFGADRLSREAPGARGNRFKVSRLEEERKEERERTNFNPLPSSGSGGCVTRSGAHFPPSYQLPNLVTPV